MRILSCFTVSAWLSLVHCFNVDVTKPIVLQKGTQGESYFGYSVLLNKQSAYVGAPIHQKSGAVFRCDFDGRNFVSQQTSHCSLAMDSPKISGRVHNNWYGASLAGNENEIFTCAPRSINNNILFTNLITSTGGCYRYDPTRKTSSNLFNMVGYIHPSGWESISVMGMTMITGSDKQLVFGTPLARTREFSWNSARMTGSIAKIDFDSNSIRISYPPANSPWSSSSLSSRSDPHNFDLAGTAITKGRFYFDDYYKTNYVVGSPSADFLFGSVSICKNCFHENSGLRASPVKVKGLQFGAKFGQTVCAVNINGDTYDDLLVGAPLHASRKGFYDTGAVYVYRTKVSGLTTELELITYDLKRGPLVSGARFGTAIANLGRLDPDIYEDFAVGAPYDGENKEGVIYIYRGSSDFDFSVEPQRISPKTMNRPQLRGFGFSLHGKVDIDDNNRPDLLVGSLLSEDAVILRAREVIEIRPRSYHVSPPKAVNPEVTKFGLSVIAYIEDLVVEDLKVEIEFKNVDERIHLASGNTNVVVTTVRKNERMKISNFDFAPSVKNFDVDLVNPTSIPKPIRFNVQLRWFIQRESCSEKIDCPILDPKSGIVENLSFEVILQSGCEDMTNCKCNLENEVNSRQDLTVIVQDNLEFAIRFQIMNTGTEPAFDTSMILELPLNADVPKVLDCNQKSKNQDNFVQEITCKLPVLMKKLSKTIDIPLVFSSNVTRSFDSETMKVRSRVLSKCSSATPAFTFDTFVRLKYDYTLDYAFQSGNQQIRQIGYDDSKIIFDHSYIITNRGPSPTNKEVRFNLLLPDTQLLDKNVKIVATPANIIKCSETPTKQRPWITNLYHKIGFKPLSCIENDCLFYPCTVQPGLKMNEYLNLFVNMTFVPKVSNEKNLYDKVYDNFKLYSHLELVQESSGPDKNMQHGSTEFFPTKTGLARVFSERWPIFLGVGIVLIVVIIVIVILYKTNGFNKMRIYKNEMEKEERLLRQSQIRTD